MLRQIRGGHETDVSVLLRRCRVPEYWQNAQRDYKSEGDAGATLETYADILRRCSKSRDLSAGKRVHALIANSEHSHSGFIRNLLVQMYANCGSLQNARLLFDQLGERSMHTWTIMVKAYGRNHEVREARSVFDEMPTRDAVAWTTIVAAYAQNGHFQEAKCLFEKMPNQGVVARNAMITGYPQGGCMQEAKNWFDRMPKEDVVAWTSMIVAYAQNGHMEAAKGMFDKMPERDVITWTAMSVAYAQSGNLNRAKRLFDQMPEPNSISWNAMVAAYAQNGHLENALSIFNMMPSRNEDVVPWNTMISGYIQNGYPNEALQLFRQMNLEGVQLNKITFATVLDACKSVDEARAIHAILTTEGLESDHKVGTALITKLSDCGSLEDARRAFDRIAERDVVLWTAMIVAYVQNEQARDAIELSRFMDLEGVQPNGFTFASIVDAYGSSNATLAECKLIHATVIESGFLDDVVVANASINMFGKRGSLENAKMVFDSMLVRDSLSWTALMAAYAQNGYPKEALELLKPMNLEGMQLTHVSFVAILSTCSHAGMLKLGFCYFASMLGDYGVSPLADHYKCMIDILGRAGHLAEAEDLIRCMPFEPDVVAWRTFLGACRIHNDRGRAAAAAQRVLQLEPQNGAPYVLLSNICVAASSG